MHKTIAGALGLFATTAGVALAHPDHGMSGVHLHWWEYALLAAAIAAIAVSVYRK